jgi:hypothetical protein
MDLTKTYKGDDFSWMSDLDDAVVPAFRCDPKIKVFTSFYSSSGSEINTVGKIPFIPITWRAKDPKWRNKKELLPGETIMSRLLFRLIQMNLRQNIGKYGYPNSDPLFHRRRRR